MIAAPSRIRLYVLVIAPAMLAACGGNKPAEVAVPPAPDTVYVVTPAPPAPPPDTVFVTDPELEQRAARLEIRALEREAQIEELQGRLDETRQEVVRSMAKLQTLATRAEAASGMAEAEVAVQSLKGSGNQRAAPEYTQASQMLEQSSAEFTKENFAGALYLANAAKRLASASKVRQTAGDGSAPRPGETALSIPIRLKAAKRSNVRDGPGINYAVLFTVEAGATLTGYSYTDTWMRVTDEGGRAGWVVRSLVGGTEPVAP